jgi:putative hydrolase of the HAD superfamily
VLVSLEVNLRKPSAGIYQMALERLGVEADQAWMIGDHIINDVLGARGAGLTGIWLRHEARVWDAVEPSNLEIQNLRQLLHLLE